MRDNYKDCNNCFWRCQPDCYNTCFEYDQWAPIPCPYCCGTLSTIRIDDSGKTYRHCYACHFEFEEKEYG